MRSRKYSDQAAVAANQNIVEKNYWLKTLSGEWVKSHFPYDNKGFGNETGQNSKMAVETFRFPDALFQMAMKVSGGIDLKLHMILVTGLMGLLEKYTSAGDIIIGSPILKQEEEADFVNTLLVFRTRLSRQMTFRELLMRVKETIITATRHQNFPLEVLPELLNLPLPANSVEFPLFDVALLLENVHDRAYLKEIHCNMLFSFQRTSEHIEGNLEYNSFLYREETVKQVINHYIRVLEKGLSDLSRRFVDIDILSKEEKHRLLMEFNANAVEYPKGKTLHQWFEEQVERTPDHIAVIGAHEIHESSAKGTRELAPLSLLMSITYRELNKKSNRLAYLLKKKGVKPDTITALMVNRSMAMFVGILGILKAGGAYMPIDPEYPQKRVLSLLKDSEIYILVAGEKAIRNFSYTSIRNLNSVNTAPYVTAPRPQIKNFDVLPIPDRSLIDYEGYHRSIGEAPVKHTVSIQATRGCPFKCAFCHKIWPKNHVYRSAENLFYEIETLYRMGIRRFVSVDDIFNLNADNSKKFFERIIKSDLEVQLFFTNGLRGDILTKELIDLMVQAGTVDFDFSLESASPRIQELIRKNLNIKKLKENIDYIITHHPHVMVELQTIHGFPTETEQEAMMTLDFINSLQWIDFPYVHMLRIFPGTDMEKIAVQHGISQTAIEESADLAYHQLSDTLPFSKEFTKQYQTKYLNEYFLSKERFLTVLPKQMKILTEDESVQKYNSFFPNDITCFQDLLDTVGISKEELKGNRFPGEDHMAVPGFNKKTKKYFPPKKPANDALRILLLDLTRYFTGETPMLYDVVNEPLGLMYLLTYLNEKFARQIHGKIAKSRMDFDNYKELKTLIEDFKPDVIGIRSMDFYKDFFHKTTALIRQWGINVPIVAGGPYATSNYKKILEDTNVDIAVLGEGELTLSELVEKMLTNNKKLPGEAALKTINGIAFIEKSQQQSLKNETVREILLLNETGEILSAGTGNSQETVNNKNQTKHTDLAYVLYTSGSGGKPKGVLVEHGNVVSYLNAFYKEFEITPEDTVIQQASYPFDAFVEEIFPLLFKGGKVALPSKEEALDIDLLTAFIRQNRVTILDCSPLLLNELNRDSRTTHLKLFISGGDTLKVEYINGLLKTGSVYNTYGPTESTVCATYYKCEPGLATNVPIGKPIANYNVYILDKNHRLVPIGIPGELCVSGPGVSRGYLNRPELTAEKFCQNFLLKATINGFYRSHRSHRSYISYLSYIYRTGDLARWLPDGNIDFLGRIDQQVKIRGYRIELGEIENRLLKHNQIKETAVLAKESDTGDKYLCAYFVPHSSGPGASPGVLKVSHLREYLAKALPGYMIPAYFVQLDRLPLTTSGKIDRNALPLPGIMADSEYDAPRDETEKKLLDIWCSVLSRAPLNASQLRASIGMNDNFFQLGGHSLKATILTSKIHKELNVKIPLTQVFKTPSIRGLADHITNTVPDKFIPILPAEKKEYYPLSPPQKSIYIQQQKDKNSLGYNMSQVFILMGAIDRKRVENVFKQLIQRHDSFRTSFGIIQGELVQEVHDRVDFNVTYGEVDEEKAGNRIKRFIKPFRLDCAPLLRLGLIKLEEKKYIWMLDMHHLVYDGASFGILLKEFSLLYEGENLSPLRLQYKDFVEWQSGERGKKTLARQKAYWQNLFAAAPPGLNLPTDFARPPVQTFKGDSLILEINQDRGQHLKNIETAEDTTLFMVLLTLYYILLFKLSGQEDIIIGTPVVGRSHAELHQVIGMFVNTLAIRNYPAKEKSFKTLLSEVRKSCLQAFENQDYPFEDLVAQMPRKRDISRNPLFDALFVLQNNELPVTKAGDLQVKPFALEKNISHYDLMFSASEWNNTIRIIIEYSSALYKKETMERVAKYYTEILTQVIENQDIKLKNINITYDYTAARATVYQEKQAEWVL